MKSISRRQLIGFGATSAVGFAAGVPAIRELAAQQVSAAEAAASGVVVVGGGMGGVTVAKYIRMWSGKSIPVTLIEANPDYTSSIMSNLVLNGQRTVSSLRYSYGKLTSTYGVTVIRGTVTAVDSVAKTVSYTSPTGAALSMAYGRLVLAPGIDMLPVAMTGTATNRAKVVHAWQAGPQTQSLRDQLLAMPVDGTFVLTIPAKPYRCPPGPYERACLVADWIKRNRRSVGNTNPQVIVLDANPSIQAEAANFSKAFTEVHAGVIRYVPNATLVSVDADTGRVTTTAGEFTGQVLNVIPPHTAGKVARDAGLATAPTSSGGAFCPVDVLTYESTAPGKTGIHVLGDASATTQPKAGHIANQEAKVCADAIVRLMSVPALPVDQAPMTNSSCYSPITATTASWLSVVYRYDGEPTSPTYRTMVPVGGGATEAPAITTGNYGQMNTWFKVLMADTFA